MDPLERVVLGRVVGAHGVRGQLRVRYFGDGPESLLGFTELWLADSADDPAPQRFEVRSGGTGRAGEVRIGVPGVSDRDAARSLRGMLVLGEATELETLPEGEYYWHEVVGCSVEARDGTRLGTVREIWETGAHDVLVIEDAAGRRQLLSTAKELMPEIDIEARRIVVELLPGLLDGP